MRCSEAAGKSWTSLRFRRGWSVRGQQASIRAFRRPTQCCHVRQFGITFKAAFHAG